MKQSSVPIVGSPNILTTSTDYTICLDTKRGKAHRTGITAFALAIKHEDPELYQKLMEALLPYNDSIVGEE